MTFWDFCSLIFAVWVVSKCWGAIVVVATDLFRPNYAALKAELKAARADYARLEKMIRDWSEAVGRTQKTRDEFKAHAKKYQVAGCWKTLGIEPTTDKDKVISAFRKKSMVAHPDKGGSKEAFQALFEARNQALRECA